SPNDHLCRLTLLTADHIPVDPRPDAAPRLDITRRCPQLRGPETTGLSIPGFQSGPMMTSEGHWLLPEERELIVREYGLGIVSRGVVSSQIASLFLRIVSRQEENAHPNRRSHPLRFGNPRRAVRTIFFPMSFPYRC